MVSLVSDLPHSLTIHCTPGIRAATWNTGNPYRDNNPTNQSNRRMAIDRHLAISRWSTIDISIDRPSFPHHAELIQTNRLTYSYTRVIQDHTRDTHIKYERGPFSGSKFTNSKRPPSSTIVRDHRCLDQTHAPNLQMSTCTHACKCE